MSEKTNDTPKLNDRFTPANLIKERQELGKPVLNWRENGKPDQIEAEGLIRRPNGVEKCLYRIELHDKDSTVFDDFADGVLFACVPRSMAEREMDRMEHEHAFAVVSADTLIREKAEREGEFRAKSEEVSSLRSRYESLKESTKIAKDKLDQASEELEELGRSDLVPPLWNRPKPTVPEPAKPTEEVPTAMLDEPEDEAWREAPIDHLAITEGQKSKLKGAGIETMGDLADWTTGGKALTDIKGIGQAAADKIADVAADWHAQRMAEDQAGFHDEEASKCEGCGKPATGMDNEGLSLCEACEKDTIKDNEAAAAAEPQEVA